MAKKTAEQNETTTPGAAEVKTLSLRVPKFSEYYRSANAYDPNSTTKFDPYRFTLIRQGKSGAVIEHQARGDETLPNEFSAVLIYTPHTLQCKCTPMGDSKTLICRSPNRRYAINGTDCKQCPYKQLDPVRNYQVAKQGYQIRTLKDYFLLPVVNNELVLARFRTTVKNIESLCDLTEKIRAIASTLNVEAATRCVVSVKIVKATENNKEVYRVDSNHVNIVGVLDDSSWNDMKDFITSLMEFNKEQHIRSSEYVQGRHNTLIASSPKAAEKSAPAKEYQAQDTTAGTAYQPPADTAPVDIDLGGEGDDEDLPF